MIAGGLNPDNVAAAINITHPWGVDVSTGVEREPGRKDPIKLREFIQAVRSTEPPEPEESDGPDLYDWEEDR
jgi:phosphoribosylanthranilate isomerase